MPHSPPESLLTTKCRLIFRMHMYVLFFQAKNDFQQSMKRYLNYIMTAQTADTVTSMDGIFLDQDSMR